MTPVYDLNQSASPFPFVDLNEDDHQQFTDLVPHQSAAAATSFHHDHYFSTFTHDQTQIQSFPESHQTDHQHKVINTYDLEGGSSDHHAISSSSTSRVTNNYSGNGTDGTMKWMATKVRLQIRKVGSSSSTDDHHRRGKFTRVARENSEEFISTGCDIVRVCSDCNTTKTPLWRSGPCGPKTLCNACGIRQRKARRALAVAAAETEAEANGIKMEATSTNHKIAHNKEKKARTSYLDTQKRKLQEKDLVNTSSSSSSASPHPDNEIKRMNKFEEFAISLSKNSSFRRVFPRDEEEAAILLMALSCGLVHG